MAERLGTHGLEKAALIVGMIWLAIWSSVGYLMILWMRARVEYSFRIPIAHSHGLLFGTLFVFGMLALMWSTVPGAARKGIVGLGLFAVLVYPLAQLGEAAGISIFLTDLTEVLFVLFLLSMTYVVYKLKV